MLKPRKCGRVRETQTCGVCGASSLQTQRIPAVRSTSNSIL